MADESEDVIRQHMEETRTALKDKLETLEQQVKETVQGATEAVETVKDSVKETVESVKETVEETVETVKETVAGTVESVKETFNLTRHVQDYPWPAFACATVVGFLGGRFLNRAAAATNGQNTPTSYLPRPESALYRNDNVSYASTPSPPQEQRRGWWSWLAEHYSGEVAKLKSLAIAAGAGVVRDLATARLEPEVADRVKELIDGFTVKLGAEPLKGPILESFTTTASPPETSNPNFAPRQQRPVSTAAR
jgi:ElaB/YqjD/DUF883 family membrane-anchored ribosome-binding protein